jgi:hypothetical protein
MKPTLAAALLALALFASVSPAAACDVYCVHALSDDAYPPAQPPLPPLLQEQVIARHGKGLSLAGFYNDPTLALERREGRYRRHWRHGPHVITERY